MAKANRPRSVWDDAEELPRAGTVDTQRLLRAARWTRWYLRASAVLLPVVLLALLANLGRGNDGDEPGAATLDVGARSVASAAVQRWLDGSPQPVPGAVLLTWDAMTVLPGAQAATDSQPASRLESHDLTILSSTGVRLQVQVLVRVVDGVGQPVGSPALVPVAEAAGDPVDPSVQWPGLDSGSASSDVTAAVTSWAQAFTSGDATTLRQQVGDPDPSHTYLPLRGLDGAVPTVGAAAWVMDTSGSDPVRTDRMVVRVTLTLPWSGRATTSSTTAATTEYDLLVEQAGSAAPRVVAWGGPGTGPVLQPYMNAIAAEVAAPDADEPVVAPTTAAAGTP
jgi:hypothetical protein